MKVALYARYSSDQQRAASIEDQLRLCRLHAERQGWAIVDSYSDRAISGASLLRPGIQELIADANRGRFQVILAEALDRLSRDQEDIAGLFKRMAYAGVSIVTLSEGEVTHLHVGLKGTMNALFLKDLADKTRRGQRGRVEQGKAGGGRCYGYDVVRGTSADGRTSTGERAIDDAQAAVVRRIFRDYAVGLSPKTIAHALNAEGVPGPFGNAWGPSTIHGSAKRANGVLNNELYVGRLVWNRQRFLKDPDTGRRIARPNPHDEWVVTEVPELRIVDGELWQQAKARQRAINPARDDTSAAEQRFWHGRRPKFLFSGLAKCGACGAGYTMISRTLVGCATARNKGTCGNRLNIRREELEARVLDGLRHQLMEPALFAEFCAEFTREINRLRMSGRATLEAARAEVKRIERDLERLVDALLRSEGPVEILTDRMRTLEMRKAEVEASLNSADEPPPVLHPSLAVVYRERVGRLAEALGREDARAEAAAVLRSLVAAIVLVPENGRLQLELKGDLAGILRLAAAQRQRPGSASANASRTTAGPDELLAQLKLVAGAGFEPTPFRL